MRKASISRKTGETDISVTVNLDGTGQHDIKTGVGFLDHMLEQFSRHGLVDVTLKARGDLHIDSHHTTEDSGIVLGQAVSKALGTRAGHQARAAGGGPRHQGHRGHQVPQPLRGERRGVRAGVRRGRDDLPNVGRA